MNGMSPTNAKRSIGCDAAAPLELMGQRIANDQGRDYWDEAKESDRCKQKQ
jgi:hypothetical protein